MYYYNIKISHDLILRLFEYDKECKKTITEVVNEIIREYLDSTVIGENEKVIRLQPGTNYRIIQCPIK